MARIILASGSPRRQELLQRMGLREFEISVPDVEEWYPPELVPAEGTGTGTPPCSMTLPLCSWIIGKHPFSDDGFVGYSITQKSQDARENE